METAKHHVKVTWELVILAAWLAISSLIFVVAVMIAPR